MKFRLGRTATYYKGLVILCPSLDCYSDLSRYESVWETGPRNSSGILDFSRLCWNFWDTCIQISPDFHLTGHVIICLSLRKLRRWCKGSQYPALFRGFFSSDLFFGPCLESNTSRRATFSPSIVFRLPWVARLSVSAFVSHFLNPSREMLANSDLRSLMSTWT